MRNVLLSAIAVLASSFALLHCAGSPAASNSSADRQPPSDEKDSGPTTSSAPVAKDAGYDAAPAVKDAGVDAADAARPPVFDAAPPPPPPSAACSALAGCCPVLSNSTDQGACWFAIDFTQGHSLLNSAECAATFATLDCAAATAKLDLGPSCAELAACCNSGQYGPYIGQDPACTDDWASENEDLCSADLSSYYNDPYGDCLGGAQ